MVSPSMPPLEWHWHLTLTDSDPPIWRQLVTPEHPTWGQLHQAIQAVMGWSGQSAYRFRHQGMTYDSAAAALVLPTLAVSDVLTYLYDPQEGWLHTLELTAIAPALSPLPRCDGGERACPPEGAGGVWGYEEVLDRLGDPEDPDYMALLDWVGWNFDPERFDLATAGARLATLAGGGA